MFPGPSQSKDYQELHPPSAQEQIELHFTTALKEQWHALNQLGEKYPMQRAFIREQLSSYLKSTTHLLNQHPIFQDFARWPEPSIGYDSSMESFAVTARDGTLLDTSQDQRLLTMHEPANSTSQISYTEAIQHYDPLYDVNGDAPWASESGLTVVESVWNYDMGSRALISSDTRDNTAAMQPTTTGASPDVHRLRHIAPKAMAVDAAFITEECHQSLPSLPSQGNGPIGSEKPSDSNDQLVPKLHSSSLLLTVGSEPSVSSARDLFASVCDSTIYKASPSMLDVREVFVQLWGHKDALNAQVLKRRLVLLRLRKHHESLIRSLETEHRNNGHKGGDRPETRAIDLLTVDAFPHLPSPGDDRADRSHWRQRWKLERKRVQNQLQEAKYWKMAVGRFGMGIVPLFPLARREGASTAFETLPEKDARELIDSICRRDNGLVANVARCFAPLTEALYHGDADLQSLLTRLDSQLSVLQSFHSTA